MKVCLKNGWNKKNKEDNLRRAYEIEVTNEDLYKYATWSIRFSLCCERIMINRYLKPLVKDPCALQSCQYAKDFLYTVCEHSFFKTMHMNA